VLPRQKRGEGMGRAAAVDVLGGWVGMVQAAAAADPAAAGLPAVAPVAAPVAPVAAPPTAANALVAFGALL
jgi:hypothetical protein